MCGIIGYIGNEEAKDKLITGLKALEYRGYDSCGIATKDKIIKTKGRVSKLEEILQGENMNSTVGIGHTRWATHGEANEINAHPHKVGKITLVHNGIIENYAKIKEKLKTQGVSFLSETDTEVACALINYLYELNGDIVNAITNAQKQIEGSYAFAIMVEGEDKIYLTRNKSPLIIAKSKNGYYLSSDMSALLHFTRKYYRMNEQEIVVLSKENVEIYNAKISTPLWEISNLSVESTRKQGYDHYMLKEIYEQSEVIKNTLSKRIKSGIPDFTEDGLDSDYFKSVKQIHIIGCGSAMHVGLVGKGLIEKYAKVPTSVFVASEYRYNPPIKTDDTLCIFISQSGETADTLASLEYAKQNGYKTLSIVNAQNTAIAISSHNVIYTYAGIEIAVATTKGYTTQLAILSLIALKLSLERNVLTDTQVKSLTENLYNEVPIAIEKTLKEREKIKSLANKIKDNSDAFYIGRGIDYYLCKEGSLKLKEISYINSQDYPAGELKHGTISLIVKDTPVIAIANDKNLITKTISNLKETKARGAFTVLITSIPEINESDMTLYLDIKTELEAIFSTVVTTQLLAYEVALLRGCDIDKPRNLAKSVTVE